jgi:hypothetical protein
MTSVDESPPPAASLSTTCAPERERSHLRALPHTGLLLIVILAIGLFVRTYQLDARSLWFDEAWSWRMSQAPLAELLERTGRDVHPPLYYILLKAWTAAWGSSEFALRSLSVLFGILTIITMYAFAAEAFGDESGPTPLSQRTALLTAALVALSVFQVRFGWEVRMYTLGTFLSALSSLMLLRALRVPDSPRWWMVYGVCGLLLLYTHYYGGLLICAQAVFVAGWLFRRHQGQVRRIATSSESWHAILACAIIAVGWLPWMRIFFRQRMQVADSFWTVPVDRWTLYQLSFQMFMEPENTVLLRSYAVVLSIFVVLVLFSTLWRPRLGSCHVFLAAVMPLALSIGLTWSGTRIFHIRYFLYAHLFILAAVAYTIARVPFRFERWCYVALVMIAFGWTESRFWERLAIEDRPGSRAAVACIQASRSDGEPVIAAHPLVYLPLAYYAHGDASWKVFDDDRAVAHFHGEPVLKLDEMISKVGLKKIQANRVWVVNSTGGEWGELSVPTPHEWVLRREFRFREVWRAQGELVVREYDIAETTKSLHHTPDTAVAPR